ncbi:hypothetical protein QQ008_02925 [Fulvivirgaceae bacterium BMA10]|uniref:Uncharacterized protein n=1 Tax=Splendidivirga corallicola TaxID=3051826 RepID=A0ABT8KJ55_9BACT|nr:hypothetical protein [Fulvivirgaceae bacterium BMA10]
MAYKTFNISASQQFFYLAPIYNGCTIYCSISNAQYESSPIDCGKFKNINIPTPQYVKTNEK